MNDLQYNEFWQTQVRGSNSNEYEIYVSCMKGEAHIKTYQEWLDS